MTRANENDFYLPETYDIPLMRQRLYALRTANQLSQAEFADKINVTRQTYGRAENGVARAIPKRIVKNIIKVFGATEDELVVLRNQKPISLAFEKWVANREVSEPYLKRAYMQYLKDTGKFPK